MPSPTTLNEANLGLLYKVVGLPPTAFF